MQKREKRGAIELSIGTIVVIVLAVSMLILGLVLIRTIFKSGLGVVTMTDQQLRKQIGEIFQDDKTRLVIYPDSKKITLKQGEDPDGFGLGIRNLVTGASGELKFRYEVLASDPNLKSKCGITEKEAEQYMVVGQSEENIPIPSGQFVASAVGFQIPIGAPLCTIRFRVNTYQQGTTSAYASEYIDVTLK